MHDEYGVYFKKLIDRANAAEQVRFCAVRSDGWEPKMGECHSNVDFWAEKHPQTKVVRGWLLWRIGDDRWNIIAHSVLEEGGQLFDITPMDEHFPRNCLPFLKHLGTEEEFSAMKTCCSAVLYPPMTYDEWEKLQSPPIDEWEEL